MRESVNTDRSLLIFDAYAKSELSDFSVSDISEQIFVVVTRSFNEFTTCSFAPKMPPSCTVVTGCYKAVRCYVQRSSAITAKMAGILWDSQNS